jgi:hypothetical protein
MKSSKFKSKSGSELHIVTQRYKCFISSTMMCPWSSRCRVPSDIPIHGFTVGPHELATTPAVLKHKLLTVGSEEEGHCGCSIGVVHGGIPHGGLALQLEVPTVAVASIPGRKVEECWNSGLDGRLEVVTASIHLKVVAASI